MWLGTDSAAWLDQYATPLVGLPAAHGHSTGTEVTVAVLDTGVESDHPALARRLASGGYNFVDDNADVSDSGNGRDDDGNGLVDEAVGHGTHVAGVVALVAPDARILPVRVLDSDGGGNVFVSAEAILYAVDQSADVVNVSFGTLGRLRTAVGHRRGRRGGRRRGGRLGRQPRKHHPAVPRGGRRGARRDRHRRQ